MLHCFAGCELDDVLVAVGLEWKDLYPEPWACARQRPNEAARKYTRRTLKQSDPLELEKRILRIAVADIRAHKPLSVEDRARVEVASARLAAAEVAHG